MATTSGTRVHTDLFHIIMRILQFCFAVVILGTAGYLLKKADWNARELITPIVFSALAILFLIPSVMLGKRSKSKGTWAAIAAMDFIIWVGYLASAGLLRRNFNGPNWQNELAVRIARGNFRQGKIARIVKTVSAFVIMNLILYFFTFLYSLYKAYRAHKNPDAVVHNEKTNLRGGHEQIDNRNSIASSAPGNTTTAPGVTRGEYV